MSRKLPEVKFLALICSFSDIALVAIAAALASASAQEIDCTEEFFRISRHPDDCSRFFTCMIGGRIDFSCDEGEIFDEVRIACRSGRSDTCEYVVPPIPAEVCADTMLRIG